MITPNRPPSGSLACVNLKCERYGETGKQNLSLRKTYGKDEIRYLHCAVAVAMFGRVSGYVFTLKNQGLNVLQALKQVLLGNPAMPTMLQPEELRTISNSLASA